MVAAAAVVVAAAAAAEMNDEELFVYYLWLCNFKECYPESVWLGLVLCLFLLF